MTNIISSFAISRELAVLNHLNERLAATINWLNLRPSSIVKLLMSLAASYVTYKTVSIYLTKRKYSHIPGLETSGYFFTHFKFLNKSFNNCIYFFKAYLDFILVTFKKLLNIVAKV